MKKEELKKLIHEMSLEKKADLCSGQNFWYIGGQDSQLPEIMVSDGPHGVRKQEKNTDHLGLEESVQSVCFPAGSLAAASFNKETMQKLGETLGNECQALGIQTLLGPSVNIKRSPLCGRNFEYLSEDPLVSGKLATAYVNGVQSKGVGTSVKHFLANNQEYRRMTSSSEIDERTLREIYLASFEPIIKEAHPWTVMSSYNRVNGTFVGDSHHFLTEILRQEWGFDGVVMSDWGGVNDRILSLQAGLDIEMPGSNGVTTRQIISAVHQGTLAEAVLDEVVLRIAMYLNKAVAEKKEGQALNLQADHDIAREICEDSLVLLKNEKNILPLKAQESILFVGEFASAPRYQGGGSSHINSYHVSSAVEAAKTYGYTATYAQGFSKDTEIIEESLVEQVIQLANNHQKIVVFAGLPDSFESEGYDRKHMHLPQNQDHLIKELAKVHKQIVVVMHNGSPVEMPWVSDVQGILEAYLGGEAVGEAVVRTLFGEVNPSGRLPETFPLHLEDNPSYLFYGGEGDRVEYREGVFVGYRYYQTKKQPVLFPFGHGLSYTTFRYQHLQVSSEKIDDTEKVTVSVDVTNTGNRVGKEVVQLYIAPAKGKIIRPVIELKEFEKVELQPNETKTVTFILDKRSFAYWETTLQDWKVETGDYQIVIGKSAEEQIATKTIHVSSTQEIPKVFDLNTTIGDLADYSDTQKVFEQFMGEAMQHSDESYQSSDAISSEMIAAMMQSMPLRQLLSFMPQISEEAVQQLINQMNTK